MDSVRSGPFGQIFRPDNFIFGQVSPLVPSKPSWQPARLAPRCTQLSWLVGRGIDLRQPKTVLACARGSAEPR